MTGTDADKDPLSYTLSTATAKGTVSITAGGAYTYSPTAAARHAAAKTGATATDKADSFTVTIIDGYGGSLAVPVSVVVAGANSVPTATGTITKPNPVTGWPPERSPHPTPTGTP